MNIILAILGVAAMAALIIHLIRKRDDAPRHIPEPTEPKNPRETPEKL